ncbi:MAG: glycosyltransferase family 9 protein [Alphaproteobacteria bacterium]|nr:glycosyltransferase family 9 protein [Alphaproteobacteria bacterium]
MIEGMGSPSFDCHAALMSLPLLCGTTIETVPATVPYLAPPADIAANWRDRLAGLKGLRAGIVWAGGPKHPNDAVRSLDVLDIRPLLDVPGVAWVSLQKGDKAPDLARLGADHGVTDLAKELHDFADTAGVVAGLDLVVAVDTSVAHLAGALGKPVLLMLPEPPDFRWM